MKKMTAEKCPSCKQPLFIARDWSEGALVVNHVICRHCKKNYIVIDFDEEGEWSTKVFEVTGKHAVGRTR